MTFTTPSLTLDNFSSFSSSESSDVSFPNSKLKVISVVFIVSNSVASLVTVLFFASSSTLYTSCLFSSETLTSWPKKLEKIIQVSREIVKKPHKLIVLKGQNAQEDLKKAFKREKYDYKLESPYYY